MTTIIFIVFVILLPAFIGVTLAEVHFRRQFCKKCLWEKDRCVCGNWFCGHMCSRRCSKCGRDVKESEPYQNRKNWYDNPVKDDPDECQRYVDHIAAGGTAESFTEGK